MNIWLQRFEKAENGLDKAIVMYSPEDDCVINFGQYLGKTFEQVAVADPDYLKWCLGRPTEEGMGQFLSWLRRRLIPEMERQMNREASDVDFQMVQVFEQLAQIRQAGASYHPTHFALPDHIIDS